MNIKTSGVALSKIVQIGVHLKRLSRETGLPYLPLYRGVNQVTHIDLNRVVAGMDFNTDALQVYPPSAGSYPLRQAINEVYFNGESDPSRILITAGGMNGLDLIVQTLDVSRVYLPRYYWGSYDHILKIRGVATGSYPDHAALYRMLPELRGSAVLICDPGNPLGEKYDDRAQYELLRWLSDHDIPVIFDSPYRHLFTAPGDPYYARLMALPNVIICESFSKSLGLSGQRIGYLHAMEEALIEELHRRLMYCTNGINAFAQQVVWSLLATETGRAVTEEFCRQTVHDIRRNIAFLRERGLLAESFYNESLPDGLFAVVRCSEEELLAHRIGSVSLAFFTATEREEAAHYSRICVSFPHESFVEYFLPVKPTV